MLLVLFLIAGCFSGVETEVIEKVAEAPAGAATVTLPDSAAVDKVEGKKVVEIEKKDELDDRIDGSLDFMTGAVVTGLSDIDPRIAELVEKTNKNKEMRYYLSQSPDIHIKSQVFVKGNRMKIILPEPSAFVRGNYYNVVYLDTQTKEAVGYCEDLKRCNDLNKRFEDIDYDYYYQLTPRDWALFFDDAEFMGTETMFNRDVTQLKFTKAGKTYKIWLYNFHGLAAKVVEDAESANPNLIFFELISNHVSDTQVEHQFVDY